MRQKALPAPGISAEKAARIYIVAEIKAAGFAADTGEQRNAGFQSCGALI